jgi:hypothetical protein
VLGIFLFSCNVMLGLPGIPDRLSWLSLFDRGNAVGTYWLILFGTALPAFIYAGLRVNRAAVEERRRTNLLVFGFVVGSLPVTLLVLASVLSPTFHEAMIGPLWFGLSRLVVYSALLSIPFITVYAVLARGALDVRLVIRAAIRYALARRTITALTILPLAALVAVLFLNREKTVAGVVAGPTGLAVLVTGSIGLLGLRFRGNALRSLDRMFFREQYDASTILGALVHGVREIRNVDQLAYLLSTEIGRALHPRFVFFLSLNPVSRLFETRGKEVSPLPETSVIAANLRGTVSPLEVAAFTEQSGEMLSTTERHWLVDTDAELLVPLLSGEGGLFGLILLGGKKSELPYSREDRGLLVDIAAATTETLARRLFPALQARLGEVEQPDRVQAAPPTVSDLGGAHECRKCGQIGPPNLVECPVCAGEMTEAPVPMSLRGVYRLETRIGRGGMGLVYRAFDTTLSRPVAVKTLVRVDQAFAARLRHEARAMASVTHPNLATIYGAETWKGRPLILVEYFAAGTMEDLLTKGPMSMVHAIELGISLAGGIEHLHEMGMLHRDIKPSNIGLTDSRKPKLLDFGLAQFLVSECAPLPATAKPAESRLHPFPDQDSAAVSLEPTRTGRFRGTVPYLSPEVLEGKRSGAGSDLWSLAVVLFESMAGANPFLRPGGAARTVAPDLRTYLPDGSPEVAQFFVRALSSDPSQRPSTAREFREQLEKLTAR